MEKYKQHLPSPDVDETFDDNITDVSCGNIYKKLKRKYKNLISLIFNTDGVKIYKSRKQSSLWPIPIVVNE